MKTVGKMVLTLVAVLSMAATASAVDKLIVKDSATPTPNTVFKVDDTGKAGVNKATPLYPVDIATPGGVSSSTLHFNATGNDTGGWLTSVADNNFFISSGAVWQNGQWIQKSPDGKSVFFGSGNIGFRAFLNTGNAVGVAQTNQIQAYLLDYSGNQELYGQLRLNVPASTAAAPVCDATKRGYLWFTAGATGVKDTLQLCAQDATNAYAWRTLY